MTVDNVFVTYSYFTGKLQATAGAYVGAIVGVVSEQFYKQAASATDDKPKNFYSSMYSTDCGASFAFGATMSKNSYSTAADVGAENATIDQIVVNETLKEVLKNLGLGTSDVF